MKEVNNNTRKTVQVSEKISILKKWIYRHARDQQQLSLLLEGSKGKRKRTQSLDVHDLEQDELHLLLWKNVNNNVA